MKNLIFDFEIEMKSINTKIFEILNINVRHATFQKIMNTFYKLCVRCDFMKLKIKFHMTNDHAHRKNIQN